MKLSKIQDLGFDWSELEQYLDSVVARPTSANNYNTDADLPGAVVAIGLAGQNIYSNAFGCRSLVPEPSSMFEQVVFDIGELTQSLLTTTLCMKLVDKGSLEVDRRLSRVFQTFGTLGKERMTIKHLLNHSSGYPANMLFYRRIAKANNSNRIGMMSSRAAVEAVYNEIFRAKLDNIPGKVFNESEVGFILLAHALESVSATSLEKLAHKLIFSPLKLRSTGFVKLSNLRTDRLEPVSEVIAPTAKCKWRDKLLCGEVFDENAWAMGGIAGHAGLFSTSEDLFKLANELMLSYSGKSTFVSRSTMDQFWRRGEGPWALGWKMENNTISRMSKTGCSISIDLEKELITLVLSNQQHIDPVSNPMLEILSNINSLVSSAVA